MENKIFCERKDNGEYYARWTGPGLSYSGVYTLRPENIRFLEAYGYDGFLADLPSLIRLSEPYKQ